MTTSAFIPECPVCYRRHFQVRKSNEARKKKLAIVGIVGSVFFYQSLGILSFFFFCAW